MEIVLLEKEHIRKEFICEEESLTHYIHKQVSQDIKKRLATCFVAAAEDKVVLGYYTLSSESLGRQNIPEKYINLLPSTYNAPVILLGRLARDAKMKGTGLGETLLIDALLRSYKLSEESIGAMAVVVDPINEKAILFYKKYGFETLPDSGKMFLPMKVIRKLINSLDV